MSFRPRSKSPYKIRVRETVVVEYEVMARSEEEAKFKLEHPEEPWKGRRILGTLGWEIERVEKA